MVSDSTSTQWIMACGYPVNMYYFADLPIIFQLYSVGYLMNWLMSDVRGVIIHDEQS